MSIGPQRPSKGGAFGSDPRVDQLLTEMPVNELFYKNSSNQMQGSGFVVPDMKLPSVLMGTDSSSNFKPFTFSPLAQQIIASNSEQMIRGMLGIEIPENLSELVNDVGYITLSQVPSQTPQVNTDWNSTGGVSQLLNKPSLSAVALSGSYNDLTNKPSISPAQVPSDWTSTSGVSRILNKPTLFSGDYADLSGKPLSFPPTPHTHTISDVTGLQGVLDAKLAVGSNIPYSVLTGAPVIPSAQIQSDWNQTNTAALDFIKNKPTFPSVNYPVTSVNTKTGTVVLNNTDVGAAATVHSHSISDVSGLQLSLDSKANSSALSGYATTSSLSSATSGLRKVETFLGTSDATGNLAITFANVYATPPDVQPQIIGGTFNQQVRVVSVSTTGCVVQAAQRNVVTLLSVEVLLGATVNLAGASITVQVTPRS